MFKADRTHTYANGRPLRGNLVGSEGGGGGRGGEGLTIEKVDVNLGEAIPQ